MADAPISFTPSLEDIRGVKPPPANVPGLSPETLEALQAAARAAAEAAAAVKPAAPSGAAEALPDDEEEPAVKIETPDHRSAEQKKAEAEQKKLRDLVEKRSPPLTLDTLVTTGRITQLVKIQPNILEVTFQTIDDPDETFALEAAEIASSTGSRGPVFLKHLGSFELAMGVVSYRLAGVTIVLPPYVDDKGLRDHKLLVARHAAIKMPKEAWRHLEMHFVWFRDRAAKLFIGDDLGNG